MNVLYAISILQLQCHTNVFQFKINISSYLYCNQIYPIFNIFNNKFQVFTFWKTYPKCLKINVPNVLHIPSILQLQFHISNVLQFKVNISNTTTKHNQYSKLWIRSLNYLHFETYFQFFKVNVSNFHISQHSIFYNYSFISPKFFSSR